MPVPSPAERDALLGWLTGQALPLWARAGVDPADRSFHERLLADGTPDRDASRRTRVQARQLYVFCEAHRFGWHPDAAAIAAAGFEAWVSGWHAPDGRPGWIVARRPAGGIADPGRDLYDQAFALLALAHLHGTLGAPRAWPLAAATLAWIDATLASPHGGWLEGEPARLPRRANPHMHLLEALLAWHRVRPDARIDRAIRQVLALFAERFFDPLTGTVAEFFDEGWAPAGEAGQVREPGHHFEWAWLLLEAQRAGHDDLREAAARLLAWACRHGLDAEGFAVEACDPAGRLLQGGRRMWGQTELLRGRLAMAALGVAAPPRLLTAGQLLATHLATPVAGSWIERYDAQRRPVPGPAPATTLYHLVSMITAWAAPAGD